MTPEDWQLLNKFEGEVGAQQGVIANLVNALAPAARVQLEIAKLQKMAPAFNAELPPLEKLKVAVVQQAIYQLKFQYAEQRDAAAELIRGADKTSDAVDLDSWDYEDEDADPPPSAIREQRKASRLAAFRKRGE